MTENNTSNAFFLVLLLIAFVIALNLFGYVKELDPENIQSYCNDIKVELFGTLLDIFIFGIIFYVIQFVLQKQEKITRLQEELDDFRDWDEMAAGYRVIGILKRLHKLGVENVNLSRCHFNNIKIISDAGRVIPFDFKKANLTNTVFQNIHLYGAIFDHSTGNEPKPIILKKSLTPLLDFYNDPETKFENCELRGISISNSHFYKFDFKKVNFRHARFNNAYLNLFRFTFCIFENCDFENTVFNNVSFYSVDLSNLNFSNTQFLHCIFVNCKLPNSTSYVIFEDCTYETIQSSQGEA